MVYYSLLLQSTAARCRYVLSVMYIDSRSVVRCVVELGDSRFESIRGSESKLIELRFTNLENQNVAPEITRSHQTRAIICKFQHATTN